MEFTVYDLVGTFGVGLIILMYLFLQFGKIESGDPLYSVCNGVGAALVLFSLWFDFNLAAFIVEFFWLLISLYGIGRYFFKKV